MRIKELSLENRPRERLREQGVGALSSAELLAIVLKTGTREENVVELCNKVLSVHGIDTLFSCGLKELQKIKGIGEAKAMQILAVFELGKRLSFAKQKEKPLLCAKDVHERCYAKLANAKKEYFLVLHLDTKNRVVKEETVSVGLLNSSLVHAREVFCLAIRESAHAIIVVHNHPSGDCAPSQEDILVTNSLMEAGEIIGIPVLDHVIIGGDTWYSFKDACD